MIQVEFKKNIKSKIISNAIFSIIGIGVMYLFLLYSGLPQEIEITNLAKLEVMSKNFNKDLVYYFMPLVVLYLINESFIRDIREGSLKFSILKERKSLLIINKIGVMVLVSAMLLLIAHVISFILVPSVLAKGVTLQVFFSNIANSSLYFKELIIIIQIILVFTLIGMIKNINLIGLIMAHLIFITFGNINYYINKLVYSGQLARVLSKGSIEVGIVIFEILILLILNIIIFERREFTE